MKFWWRVALALSLLLTLGCDDNSLLEEVERLVSGAEERLVISGVAGEEAADDGESTSFALLRTESDTSGDRPSLCLVFSRPLDPQRDYEPFVAIDRNVAIAAKGQRLCLEGLRYGEEVAVTVRRGLPALNGAVLADDEDVQLSFSERPPVVRFAGNGVILPKTDGDGLAITTVNVDEVSVRISRLTDRALVFKRITEGYGASEGRWRYIASDERPASLGEDVYEGTLVTAGPQNAAKITTLPIREALGTLKPGAYYVEIEDAQAVAQNVRSPARAGRWVIVTDLAMTAYRGSSGLDVTVRSLQNAKPQRGKTVRLVARSNEVLAEAKTDRDGRVRFDAALLRGKRGLEPELLTVQDTDDFALLNLGRAPLDLSTQPVGGAPSPEQAFAYLYLDRGIYRPGETVHASALVRDTMGYAEDDRPGALVLYRPNGLEQTRERFTALERAGALVTSITLPKAASRGVWRLALLLDGLGEVGSTTLNVEDFVPQRLKLSLNADTDTPLRADERRFIEADLQFLYGAPGAGLKVTGTARIETDQSPFEGYTGYRFGLAREPFRQRMIDLDAATTDGAGLANLALQPGTEGALATSPLRVRAVVRAEEPGGRAVQEDVIIPYRPRETYLGLRGQFGRSAPQDEPLAFDVVVLDRMGTLKSVNATWRLYRNDYDYDWYQEQNGRWRWRRSERRVTVAEGAIVTDTDGPTVISVPALPWGNYELLTSLKERDMTSSRFYVGYGGRSANGKPAPDSVQVYAPEEPVKIGETAEIAINAPYPGLAEIAIATGEVISLQHIAVPEGGTSLTVPVDASWGAGAYVLVSVYTDRDPESRPVPRRAVGAAYLPVNREERVYDVSLSLPKLARPNKPLEIGLSVPDRPQGSQLYATLAAVDEGILLLTKYQSPDPVEALFGKRKLGIEIYDDYGRLLDPNQGEVGALRSGGDSIGGAGLSAVPTQSVVLFEGPINLGADGQAVVNLDLPDFNGELRVMAVVWSDQGVGSTSMPLTVRDPLPAELILPRFLAPGDEAVATLTVDNVEGSAGTYTAQISSASDVVNVGETEVSLTLGEGERQDRAVALKAEKTGSASLGFDLTGPQNFSAESQYPLEVRGAFLPINETERVMLEPGASYTLPDNLFTSFVPGSGEVLVSVSSTPINVVALSASLSRYPYQCTEQLVSRALPLLLKADRTARENQQLQTDIEALLERQSPDGAFGMWRVGDRLASPWLGAYATDFIARAREQKFAVPEEALKRAYQALQPISQGEMRRAYGYDSRSARSPYSEDSTELLSQRAGAYALYVLTRGGSVDRSRLRYVHDAQINDIASPVARAQVGAALAALGDEGRAQSAFDAAKKARDYQNEGDWYQSPLRDDAAIAAYLAEAGRTETAARILVEADRKAPELNRLHTQEKAFLLLAATTLAGDNGQGTARFGEEMTNAELFTEKDDKRVPFTNEGSSPLFLTVQKRGVPQAPPGTLAEQLTLTKRLFSIDGSVADPASIKRGDRLLVQLTLQPQRRARAQYVITDLLPAGFEIEAILQPEDGAPSGPYADLGQLRRADVAEARDDRFVVSDVLQDTDVRRYAYIVRAVTPGQFTAPGAVAEDMYRVDVAARTPAGKVTIAP